MTQLDQLSNSERTLIFEVASDELNMPFEIVEKDFWVVWTLEMLFSILEINDHLTFKGGTSLSKIYNVIQRFSEDIDVSIEKDFFGFDQGNDPESAHSKNKRRAALDNLSASCSSYIQNDLLRILRDAISAKLNNSDEWRLEIDAHDPDGQTLLFEYPGGTDKEKYIRPIVKIEMGARAEHWPVSKHRIQSYAKVALNDKVTEQEIMVKVLDAKRTFWEKATILHQYAHLPQDKKLPVRISRHYYDFFCLLNSSIKSEALQELELLDRVATHKSIYFSSAWASYGTAKKGTLKLLPQTIHLDALERDYGLMKDMFYGDIPYWNDILNLIGKFELEFNEV
jgi:hypothetical protein